MAAMTPIKPTLQDLGCEDEAEMVSQKLQTLTDVFVADKLG